VLFVVDVLGGTTRFGNYLQYAQREHRSIVVTAFADWFSRGRGGDDLTVCGCVEPLPGPCTRARAPLRPHCDCREAFKDPRGRHKKCCRFYRDRDRSKTKVQPKFEIRRLGKSLYQCSCRALHLDNRCRHNLKCCFYVQRAKALNKGKSTRRTESRRARPNSTRRVGPRPPPRSRGRGGDDLTVDGNIERNPGPSPSSDRNIWVTLIDAVEMARQSTGSRQRSPYQLSRAGKDRIAELEQRLGPELWEELLLQLEILWPERIPRTHVGNGRGRCGPKSQLSYYDTCGGSGLPGPPKRIGGKRSRPDRRFPP
jgi:hypothetical protein